MGQKNVSPFLAMVLVSFSGIQQHFFQHVLNLSVHHHLIISFTVAQQELDGAGWTDQESSSLEVAFGSH